MCICPTVILSRVPRSLINSLGLSRFNAYAATLIRWGHPVALCRDFNVVPTDFDIYDIRSWKQSASLQPESRAAYAELLDQGWTDALRHLFSQEQVYTFWDYFRNHWQRNSRLRIDHVLLTPDQRNRLKAAGVDRFVRNECHASDHAPVWIELRDQSRGKAAGELRSGGTSRPPKRAAGSNKHI